MIKLFKVVPIPDHVLQIPGRYNVLQPSLELFYDFDDETYFKFIPKGRGKKKNCEKAQGYIIHPL